MKVPVVKKSLFHRIMKKFVKFSECSRSGPCTFSPTAEALREALKLRAWLNWSSRQADPGCKLKIATTRIYQRFESTWMAPTPVTACLPPPIPAGKVEAALETDTFGD